MIQTIEGLPSYVAAFKATGEVTKDDYDNLVIPRVQAVDEQHGHIHFLLVLETGAENFSFASWMKDAAMGLKHFRGWKKIAIVTDQKSVANMTSMASFVIPGKTKSFALAKLDEAKEWVAKED